jgi:ABC-type multidrug transport system fused ATPase/permease subunit
MLYQGQLQSYTSNLVDSLSNLIKSTGAGSKVFSLLDRQPQKRPEGSLALDRRSGPGPSAGPTVLSPLMSSNCLTEIQGAPAGPRGFHVEFCDVSFAYSSRPNQVPGK